jgi:hypothetical protein
MRTWLRFGPITLRIAAAAWRPTSSSTRTARSLIAPITRLTGYRRLALRYERSARLFAAFRTLAATLTYYKKVTAWDKIQYCNGTCSWLARKQQLKASKARCETRASHTVAAGHAVGAQQVPLQY